MSTIATLWAAHQRPPRPADKLVLWAMADAAREELLCFTAVATICEFSGLDRKTVMAAQARLKDAGMIIDTGDRRGDTRQIVVWRLPVETVPKTEQSQKRNCPVSPPKESRKRDTEPVSEPLPPKEPIGSLPPGGGRRSRGSRIPDGWKPIPIADLPEHAGRVASLWQAGAYEAEAEAHRAHWLAETGAKAMRLDWDAVWVSRIVQIGAKPLRDARAGVRHTRPVTPIVQEAPKDLVFTKPGEDAGMADWRTAAAVTIGAGVYRRLLDDAQMVLDDETLTITVRGAIVEQELEASHLFRLQPLTERILRRRLTRLQVTRRAA